MDDTFADLFAAEWLAAWNDHDLEAILSHFADEVVFSSPLAQRIVEGSDGVIRGKEALRAYWREGLRRGPELHFEIEDLYLGVSTIVIHYRNHSGGLVNEVLTFDGPLVIEGHATYLRP
ncbi:MAG: nuclear transport factor 2 family protein [Acidimicrobiales bacterium]|jgi:ketosteroid isomerase-like protein